MPRSNIAACAALLATAIAGCASSSVSPSARPIRSATPAQALRVACPGGNTAAARRSAALPEERIPAQFVPAAVVLCNPAIVFVNHNGRNVPSTRRVATTGLGRLMTALRAPSAPPDSNVACLDQATYVPWFVLVGRNGRVIRPKVPVTVCGDPSPAVLASLNALRWTTPTRRRG
jgi:hypothetical protein